MVYGFLQFFVGNILEERRHVLMGAVSQHMRHEVKRLIYLNNLRVLQKWDLPIDRNGIDLLRAEKIKTRTQ